MTGPSKPGTEPRAAGTGNAGLAMHLALLLLRLALGTVFIYHGSQKVFGAFDGMGLEKFATMLGGMGLPVLPAYTWAAIVGWSEFLGGCLVLVGLLTRVASVPLIVTMLVAIGTVTGQHGFNMGKGGYEYNVVLIAVAGALVLCGAGLVSVDAFIFRRGLWARGAAGGAMTQTAGGARRLLPGRSRSDRLQKVVGGGILHCAAGAQRMTFLRWLFLCDPLKNETDHLRERRIFDIIALVLGVVFVAWNVLNNFSFVYVDGWNGFGWSWYGVKFPKNAAWIQWFHNSKGLISLVLEILPVWWLWSYRKRWWALLTKRGGAGDASECSH